MRTIYATEATLMVRLPCMATLQGPARGDTRRHLHERAHTHTHRALDPRLFQTLSLQALACPPARCVSRRRPGGGGGEKGCRGEFWGWGGGGGGGGSLRGRDAAAARPSHGPIPPHLRHIFAISVISRYLG